MPSTTLKFAEFQHILGGHADPTTAHFHNDIKVAAENHIRHRTGLVHATITLAVVDVNVAIGSQVFRFTCNPDMDAIALKNHLRAH